MTTMHEPELPFGYPGRNPDDTPVYFDSWPLPHHRGPLALDPPDVDADVVVHYGPGDQPLCGADSWIAVYTEDPAQVNGCADCIELVEEDVGD